MVLTVFKSEALNHTPKAVLYRKCKHFDSDNKNFKDTIIDSLNKLWDARLFTVSCGHKIHGLVL